MLLMCGQAFEELGRCQNADTKLLRTRKVGDIVRDDAIACRLDRQLKNHVVFRVTKKRAPEEIDLSVLRDGTQIVKNVVDV